jgi:hypothetical protein
MPPFQSHRGSLDSWMVARAALGRLLYQLLYIARPRGAGRKLCRRRSEVCGDLSSEREDADFGTDILDVHLGDGWQSALGLTRGSRAGAVQAEPQSPVQWTERDREDLGAEHRPETSGSTSTASTSACCLASPSGRRRGTSASCQRDGRKAHSAFEEADGAARQAEQ